MTIEAPTRAEELSHYFMIMGLMAKAKAADDVTAMSELIDELDAIVRFSRTARIRSHARAEIDQAAALLVDIRTRRICYIGYIDSFAVMNPTAKITVENAWAFMERIGDNAANFPGALDD